MVTQKKCDEHRENASDCTSCVGYDTMDCLFNYQQYADSIESNAELQGEIAASYVRDENMGDYA